MECALNEKNRENKAKNQQKRGRRGHFLSILQEPAKTSKNQQKARR